jgi:hypothetical protein
MAPCKYAYAEPRIWRDQKLRGLEPLAPHPHTLLLYLLLNEARNAFPGLIFFRATVAADDLRWSSGEVVAQLRRLIELDIAQWDEALGVVFLPNAPRKYPFSMSDNVARGWRKAWNEFPDCQVVRNAFSVAADAIEHLLEEDGRDASSCVAAFVGRKSRTPSEPPTPRLLDPSSTPPQGLPEGSSTPSEPPLGGLAGNKNKSKNKKEEEEREGDAPTPPKGPSDPLEAMPLTYAARDLLEGLRSASDLFGDQDLIPTAKRLTARLLAAPEAKSVSPRQVGSECADGARAHRAKFQHASPEQLLAAAESHMRWVMRDIQSGKFKRAEVAKTPDQEILEDLRESAAKADKEQEHRASRAEARPKVDPKTMAGAAKAALERLKRP